MGAEVLGEVAAGVRHGEYPGDLTVLRDHHRAKVASGHLREHRVQRLFWRDGIDVEGADITNAQAIREVRNAATELTSGLESEYKDIVDPIRDAREEMRDAIAGLDQKAALPPEPADPLSTNEQPAGDDTDEGAS